MYVGNYYDFIFYLYGRLCGIWFFMVRYSFINFLIKIFNNILLFIVFKGWYEISLFFLFCDKEDMKGNVI